MVFNSLLSLIGNTPILKANNFLNVGEFEKSKEYFKKALEI